MMRQASIRNQRNKGLRVKNVLQICLLAAVFFWLLYQLKHSYDKKKGLDERNSRILNNAVDGESEIFDLGRKDLPRGKVSVSEDKSHKKEDENEEAEEENEVQREMEDEEAKGIEDDRIDEQDNEQGDEQDDQERGDEEAEDGEESVNEEDKDFQVEEAEFLDDQDHEEEGSSQEAREESYKGDDASSAVHRENQLTGSNDKDGSVDEEQLQNNEKEVETHDTVASKDDGPKDSNNASVAVVVAMGNDTIHNNSLIINRASVEEIGRELSPPDNQTKLQANSTMASVSDNQVNLQTDLPVTVTSNGTEGRTNIVPLGNGTLSRSSVEDQNTTIALGSPEEDNSNLKSVVEEQPKKSNTTIGQDNLEELPTVSLDVNENGDAVEGELAGSSHRTVTEEERDARIDQSTLPDIQNDVKNIEDEAAE